MSSRNDIINILSNYPEWHSIEYIYIDRNITKTTKINKQILKDKIIITKNSNELFRMIDYNILNNKDKLYDENYSKLNYVPVADLIVIGNDVDNTEDIEQLIDKNTIISKVLSDNVYFIEDTMKELLILITPHETYILKGHGLNMELLKGDYLRNTWKSILNPLILSLFF